MTNSQNIHVVYGPRSSGKSTNEEAIKYLLRCDVAFDCYEQPFIREALKEGRSVLVFSEDAKPKARKGYRGLFDGAEASSVDAIRSILGCRWVEKGPTQGGDDAEEGMARTLRYPPYEIHLLLIVREDYLNKSKRKYIGDDMRQTYKEAADTINKIIGIVEDHLAS